MSSGAMKFLGPFSLNSMHLGHSYSEYSKCLPPHKPAPTSTFRCSWSIIVYPKDSPPPNDFPSSKAGRQRPALLKEEYLAIASIHHPEYTYHGQ